MATPSGYSPPRDHSRSPSPASDRDIPLIQRIPVSVTSEAEHSNDDSGVPEKPNNGQTNDTHNSEPLLKYRRAPIILLVVYLITVIVPWVLICILDQRPLTASSYWDQNTSVGESYYSSMEGALIFANVLRTVSAVFVIPITSSILAYAAVVYSQRRSLEQNLTTSQLMALADRGWANMRILLHSQSPGREASSSLLWLGALLIVLGALIQPLQSGLVGSETIMAITCGDLPDGGCTGGSNVLVAGYDATPWDMQSVEHNLVVAQVANEAATLSTGEAQVNIWADNPYEDEDSIYYRDSDPTERHTLRYYVSRGDEEENPGSTFFVAALPNGTHTGVLRQHAMRFNSSVECRAIPRHEYPSTCQGARPLDIDIRRSGLNIRVCAPGEIGAYPWTFSRNRQDIEEEIYIDHYVEYDRYWDISPDTSVDNYTVHCTAGTTRGYFELGNVMNGFEYGPLLDSWPYDDDDDDRGEDPDTLLIGAQLMDDPFDVGILPVSGPLMMAANALFGNSSWLQYVFDNSTGLSTEDTMTEICEHGNFPFSQTRLSYSGPTTPGEVCSSLARSLSWQDDEDNEDPVDWDVWLDRALVSTAQLYDEAPDARQLLEFTMFLANRALLTNTVNGASGYFGQRAIYAPPGTEFVKPSMSLASMIVVTILIGLQTIGLSVLVWYACSFPTWTGKLDALAMARIGVGMSSGLPEIRPVVRTDLTRLMYIDGLIGVVDEHESEEQGEHVEHRERLGLGGLGLVSKRLAGEKQEL